jgi:hypothetical protein
VKWLELRSLLPNREMRCSNVWIWHFAQISSREFTVGIGWKADIGRQVVSAKPVAIDPKRRKAMSARMSVIAG